MELTAGPVLYVAEILALLAHTGKKVVYALGEIEGVEALCAHITFGDRRGWTLIPWKDLRPWASNDV